MDEAPRSAAKAASTYLARNGAALRRTSRRADATRNASGCKRNSRSPWRTGTRIRTRAQASRGDRRGSPSSRYAERAGDRSGHGRARSAESSRGGFARHDRAMSDHRQAPRVLRRIRTRARLAMPVHRGRARNRARSALVVGFPAARATDESKDVASVAGIARGVVWSGTASTRRGGAGRGESAGRRSVAQGRLEMTRPVLRPQKPGARIETRCSDRLGWRDVHSHAYVTRTRRSRVPGRIPGLRLTPASGSTHLAWASVPECHPRP
jgi:hypothetical protein